MTRDDVLEFIDHPVYGRLYLEVKIVDNEFTVLYRGEDKTSSLGTIAKSRSEAYRLLREKLIAEGYIC